MDEELRKLQELFSQAQEVKSTVRLSERNVIELVNKLKQLGLLGDDLLHSVNGKEYITVKQLRMEMRIEVHKQGRISLVDLATTLGVDLFHIERQAEILVAEDADTSLVQGELLTATYWDTVAEEIDEALQETGQVSVGELARQFNVGVELLTGAITARLDMTIHGKLESGMLYTPAYVACIRAMVRGALRGATVPCSVLDIWTSLQKLQQKEDKDSVASLGGDSLYFSVLMELVAEGELKGALRGGKTTWTPAVFSRSQRESVENFYSQNGQIAYASLKKLAIPNPKQYLEGKYPDGIALETVFVHPSLVNQLDAAVEEALANGTWCEAEQHVPSTLSGPDIVKLLALCPSVSRAEKAKSAALLLDTCLVAESLLKACLDKCDTLAGSKAAAALLAKKPAKSVDTAAVERQSLASTSAAAADDSEGETSKSKRGGKKGRKGNPLKFAESEDEEDEGKGGKGGKKGRRNKAGKAGGSGTGANSKTREEEKETDGAPTDREMESSLLEWYPDLEGVGAGPDAASHKLAMAIVRRLRPQVVATFIAAKRAAFTAGAEDRRKRRDTLLQKLEDANLKLQLLSKALELFEDDATTGPVLHRHLLRTTATEAAHVLLMSESEASAQEEGEAAPEQSAESMSAAQRAAVVRSLPKGVSDKARVMVSALEGKDVGRFQDALESTADACGVRLKKLDKKLERALLHAHKKGLLTQLEAESSAVAALPLVVAALYVQLHSRALQAPGRAMAAAIARLKEDLSPEAYLTLSDHHRATVDLLSAKAALADDDDEAEVLKKEQDLNDRLAALKALTFGPSEGAKANP